MYIYSDVLIWTLYESMFVCLSTGMQGLSVYKSQCNSMGDHPKNVANVWLMKLANGIFVQPHSSR